MPDIGDIFKEFVWGPLVKYAISLAVSKLPFLGLPIINPIFGVLVGWVAGLLYDAGKEFVDFEVIGFKNEKHKNAYSAANVELRYLAVKNGIDSAEYKAAREKHGKALRDFVKWNID